MSTYTEWREMWDESGPWSVSPDDIAMLFAEIDRLRTDVGPLRDALAYGTYAEIVDAARRFVRGQEANRG